MASKRQKLDDSNNASSFGNTANMMSYDGGATYHTATPNSPIVNQSAPAFRQTENGPIGLSNNGRQNLLTNLTFLKQAYGGRNEDRPKPAPKANK
mgnify:CR=1 FL=1